MDYYILLDEDKPITQIKYNNNICRYKLPFTYKEIIKCKKNYPNAKIINISKDIAEEKIIIKNSFLGERQAIYSTWLDNFLNNNINGFSTPRYVNGNDEYITQLKDIFENYKKEIQKIAFKHETNLFNDVNKNCDNILKALEDYLTGNIDNAKLIIASLIKEYINDPFWVSDLDKSYAFRGIAPFIDLHSIGYDKIYKNMMDGNIDFYRARNKKINKDRKEILHIPYKLINLIEEHRFSLKGQPCLYFGTSSYVCWTELGEPKLSEFYLSGFRANELGKKLKIFNLVASQPLINGIYQRNLENNKNNNICKFLQNSMIKLMPLILATSFSINDKSRNQKYEYIISQLIMKSLLELGIDGVAYLSKRGKDDFQYPQGVNLAIPVLDINEKKEYGDVCNKFIITEPEQFTKLLENTIAITEKSYINKHFEDYNQKFNQYSKVDNIISSKEYNSYR